MFKFTSVGIILTKLDLYFGQYFGGGLILFTPEIILGICTMKKQWMTKHFNRSLHDKLDSPPRTSRFVIHFLTRCFTSL